MDTRRIKNRDTGYTDTLDLLVTALCADYARRESALRDADMTTRVAMEYRYLNFRIFEAAAEIAGESYARIYIDEIGRHIGYANSDIPAISESTYKLEKQQIKLAIARKLYVLY